MPRNKITDLRNHLFEMLEKLQEADEKDEDKLKPLLDKSKAITGISQQIINSAKLEIDFVKTSIKSGGLLEPTEFLAKSPNQISEDESKKKK